MPNSDLIDLDPEAIKDVKVEKKKALQAAYNLAAEQHPLSYYKNLLKSYQDDLIQQEKARAAKAATPKGKKKAASEEDEDVEMEDSPGAEETPAKDTKKRKAGEGVDVSLIQRGRRPLRWNASQPDRWSLTETDATALGLG